MKKRQHQTDFFRNDIAFSPSPRQHRDPNQHIFKEDAVVRSEIVDQHVCHSSDELAVPDDGRA